MTNELDPISLAWPDGSEEFIDLARIASPDLSPDSLQAVGVRLFGTPYGRLEWTPAKGQTARSVLKVETCVITLLVQAWSDRVQWALSTCEDPDALANYSTGVRVMRSAIRYLPGDDLRAAAVGEAP